MPHSTEPWSLRAPIPVPERLDNCCMHEQCIQAALTRS